MQHQIVSREDWIAARKELLKEEKDLTRRSDELARRRQELPWVRVGKEYRFETDEGSASLADLFGGRSQLLVYHFMFGPDWTAGSQVEGHLYAGMPHSFLHAGQIDPSGIGASQCRHRGVSGQATLAG
jgi:predicted dithiol-disulfide oxidoreductase (DUF899 family)